MGVLWIASELGSALDEDAEVYRYNGISVGFRFGPVRTSQFRDIVFLFPLHPPVLEPYFYLALRETEHVRDLYPSPAGKVAVIMELFFQLQRLVTRVRLPRALLFVGDLR